MVESMGRYLLCFLVYAAVANSSTRTAADAPQRLEPFLTKNTRLMVFSPHPDDEIWQPEVLFSGCSALGDRSKSCS